MANTIVHFTGADVFGGAEQILLNVLEGLNRDRWRPVLLHHPEPALDPLLEPARRAGVRTVPLPRMGGAPAFRKIGFALRALRAERPVIFHAHLSVPQYSALALAAAAFARIPVIVVTEQLFQDFTSRPVLLMQRFLSLRVKCYIAVSDDLAGRLRQTLRIPTRKIRVIRNAIAVNDYDRAPDPALRRELTGGRDIPVVFTPARLHEQKGIDFLIDAAVRLPQAVFTVAGEGPLRAALEEKTRKAKITDRFRFLGYRADIPALLAASDVFVLPSLYEGLPLSVLEAMAAGKPVIATRVGGTPEAITDGETGILVPPSSSQAIADAIETVLSNPALAARLGAAARERARAHFSAEGMVRRISDLYEELLCGGPK